MVRVDESFWTFRGKLYCHMTANSMAELHAFADQIGLKRAWFHGGRVPHYDLAPEFRARALAAGAVFVRAIDQAKARRRGGEE